MTRKTTRSLLWLLIALGWAGPVCAQSSEEEELAPAFGDTPFVTIASGSRLPVSRAPSVATVITAEDIQAIDATDLDEALETVPGLHVARGTPANMPVYVMRGIHRDANSQVLMLLNGIPLTAAFQGNRGDVWNGLHPFGLSSLRFRRIQQRHYAAGNSIDLGVDFFGAGMVSLVHQPDDFLDGAVQFRVGLLDRA